LGKKSAAKTRQSKNENRQHCLPILKTWVAFFFVLSKRRKEKRATESGRFDNDIREHEEVVLRGKRKLLCSLLLILSLDEESFPLCELFLNTPLVHKKKETTPPFFSSQRTEIWFLLCHIGSQLRCQEDMRGKILDVSFSCAYFCLTLPCSFYPFSRTVCVFQ